MPRANDISKWRRLAMQTVMWAILGVTLALAAWVNAHAARMRNALSPPLTLGGDIQIQLPRGWYGAEDGDSMIEVRESSSEIARLLRVNIGRPNSLLESFRALTDVNAMEGATRKEQIQLAGKDATLTVRKVPVDSGIYYLEVTAAAIVPPGNRKLTIELRDVNHGRKSEIQDDIELVKRVAGSVRVDGREQ